MTLTTTYRTNQLLLLKLLTQLIIILTINGSIKFCRELSDTKISKQLRTDAMIVFDEEGSDAVSNK